MPITIKGTDFWGAGAYTFIRPKQSLRKVVARLLNQKSMRSDRALINTLLGTVAGSTATDTMKRVEHSQTELGGKRVIETETIVNRATTAADDTDLTGAYLTYASRPTYPVDKATRP